MANYIITNNKAFFEKIGDYMYCDLEDMVLPQAIAVDTETTGLFAKECRMFAIQIGTGENNYLIDMQSHNNGIDFQQVIPYLEGKTMIYHNSSFDLGFFYMQGFFPRDTHDTFLASRLLHIGKPFTIRHGFAYVMERELGLQYDKSAQKNIAKTQLRNSKAIKYCFNDVDRLLDLGRVLMSKIKKQGMWEAYDLHRHYARALAYVELSGLPISEERWLAKVEKDEAALINQERIIIDYIYDNLPQFRDLQVDMFDTSKKINVLLTSPKQMIPVFNAFGIDTINKDGKDSIKEDVISKSKHEFVGLWKEYQNINHNLTTYGRNILEKIKDGRIYTSYNPILNTGRISTRKGGINFLNFPADKTTRECFVAGEGYKIVQADYNGQENYVGCDQHEDEVMMSAILEGKCLHCAFARVLYPELEFLSDSEIKENYSHLRKASKAPRFLFVYGGNGFTLSTNQGISLKEGQRIEGLFKGLHKGVYVWGQKVYDEAVKVGYISINNGFRIHLDYYDEFLKLKKEVEGYSKEFWQKYKKGKIETKKKWDSITKNSEDKSVEIYEIPEEMEEYVELYKNARPKVSKFFKRKSAYMRQCLNWKIQSISAAQTKAAVVKIFDTILDRGDQWEAMICVVPHDEIVMEVKEDIAQDYKLIIERSMIEEGNKYLTSGLFEMDAEATVTASWYEGKI